MTLIVVSRMTADAHEKLCRTEKAGERDPISAARNREGKPTSREGGSAALLLPSEAGDKVRDPECDSHGQLLEDQSVACLELSD